MSVAVLALGGVFLSLYLLLYRLGFYGGLVCGAGGSCETVQASAYAEFLGVPVAGWGVAWYVAVFAGAMLALHASDHRALADRVVGGLAILGVLFSAYLTWVELFILDAICRWCVVSAVLTVVILGLALSLLRDPGPETDRPRNEDPTPSSAGS